MPEDNDLTKLLIVGTPPASDPISMVSNVLYLPFQAINNMMMANTLAMLSTYQSQSTAPEQQAYAPQTPTPTVQPIKTHIFEKTNFKINGALTLIDVVGNGMIEELLLKAPSNGFSIALRVDNQPEYQRTWTELNAATEDIESITAVHRNGKYIVHLTDINYSQTCNISVSGPGITFNKIFMKVTHGGQY